MTPHLLDRAAACEFFGGTRPQRSIPGKLINAFVAATARRNGIAPNAGTRLRTFAPWGFVHHPPTK